MLDQLLGSKTAARIFLHVLHHGESYPTAVAHDFGMTRSQTQRQFDRFENANILVSRRAGRTRLYTFNLKFPVARALRSLVEIVYDSYSLSEKERLFVQRRRPRRRGKPVISRIAT